MDRFLQAPPQLPDAWASDRALRESLQWYLGDEIMAEVEPELAELGAVATAPETVALSLQADKEAPQHIPYSAWGERIDQIRVSPAYVELGRIGIEAGVTALPYEGSALKENARVVWAGLILLWAPSSAMYGCPVAMTDAAARTLLLHGDEAHAEVVRRLTTRDYSEAWTSGQWMTETAGGSDVGRTGTVARRDEFGQWRLHGTKWFTSSTTSETALTLARPEGAPEGSRGLGLFRVNLFLEDGSRNAIVVRRLKDKLGTRALPTAELKLEGALAYPVGDPMDGGGVRRISTMLNLTRIHNALGAVGAMGRGLAMARSFAEIRTVFGEPLHTLPAHRATLAELAVDRAAGLALVMKCCALTGRAE
ncbi:MAG TPA: acyl-CoA dehydrogenase family protein, partial [Actinomycetota bacterium]